MNYEEFIDRYKSLKHRGKIEGALHTFKSNFSCGDSIDVYVKVRGSKIVDAKFDGKGCVLSFVSADILCDYLMGKELDDLCELDFNRMVELIGFMPSVGRKGCVEIILNAVKSLCKGGAREDRRTQD